MARRTRGRGQSFLRALALLVLGVVAIGCFALAFFPFERLQPALVARLEHETRSRVELARLEAGLSSRGPYAELEGLRFRWPDESSLAIDSLRITPALSVAWLRGVPTARVTSAGAAGSFDGIASGLRIAGALRSVDPSRLPQRWFGGGGAPIAGPLDADVDLARDADQWSGDATFSGGKGILSVPGLPVSIPYDELRGALHLDEIGSLAVDHVTLRGPLASAVANGTVAAGYAGPATGAIDITIDVERLDPALVPALAQYGLSLNPASGAGQVRLSGTPEQVQVR